MTAGATAQIAIPVANVLRAPSGARDRQLLLGADVDVLESADGGCHVAAQRDGYRGWLPANDLRAPLALSHKVIARSTHSYEAPDFKSAERVALSFGTGVQLRAVEGRFTQTDQGWIPSAHLAALPARASDPIEIAQMFLGTPYLWGGNSAFGIDCSGLVQMACHACGIDCPGDSGPQEKTLGQAVPAGQGYQRGDLLFWRGHVAWVVDGDRILHANAFDMAVVYEDLQAAISRIQAQGDGPVTSHRRLATG